MDEGEGLRFKMEAYKASSNGSHTVVQSFPQGLYVTQEGLPAKHEIFNITIFHHKMRRNEKNCSLLYRLYSLLLGWKAFINLPVGVWGKIGWGLWPPHTQKLCVLCILL